MIDYQNFWRGVTDDGKLDCALKGSPCHRCEGTGFVPEFGVVAGEVAQLSLACSLCHGCGVMKCGRILDAHHYFPKRRIDLKLGGKRKPASIAAKQDVRNGVPLCREHHDLVELGAIKAPAPPFYPMFLHDHGLHDANYVSEETNSLGPPLLVAEDLDVEPRSDETQGAAAEAARRGDPDR
jgi:hypothetical protein